MKKLACALLALALVVSLASCDLMAAIEAKTATQLTGTTWEMKTMVDSADATKNQTLPTDILAGMPDLDGDGTNESAVMSMYMRFETGTAKAYQKLAVTDGGTDTATLATMGMVSGLFTDPTQDATYTISGNTVTVNGSPATYSISGTTLTIVEGTQTSTLVAVTSPSTAELAAAATGSF